MSGLGLTLDDFDDTMEVWPENWPVFCLFSDLRTQWRIGMNGATGLDYNVLFHKMDRMKLSDDQYEEFECDVRLMEAEALSTMNTKT